MQDVILKTLTRSINDYDNLFRWTEKCLRLIYIRSNTLARRRKRNSEIIHIFTVFTVATQKKITVIDVFSNLNLFVSNSIDSSVDIFL